MVVRRHDFTNFSRLKERSFDVTVIGTVKAN